MEVEASRQPAAVDDALGYFAYLLINLLHFLILNNGFISDREKWEKLNKYVQGGSGSPAMFCDL